MLPVLPTNENLSTSLLGEQEVLVHRECTSDDLGEALGLTHVLQPLQSITYLLRDLQVDSLCWLLRCSGHLRPFECGEGRGP